MEVTGKGRNGNEDADNRAAELEGYWTTNMHGTFRMPLAGSMVTPDSRDRVQ